jgi:hypothetical protein
MDFRSGPDLVLILILFNLDMHIFGVPWGRRPVDFSSVLFYIFSTHIFYYIMVLLCILWCILERIRNDSDISTYTVMLDFFPEGYFVFLEPWFAEEKADHPAPACPGGG